MTPSEWAPSASEYTTNNRAAAAPFFNNAREIGSLGAPSVSEYEGGGGSASNFDKLEIKKLKDDVEALKTQLDITARERDNNSRDLRE